jgi:hypothetical protein
MAVSQTSQELDLYYLNRDVELARQKALTTGSEADIRVYQSQEERRAKELGLSETEAASRVADVRQQLTPLSDEELEKRAQQGGAAAEEMARGLGAPLASDAKSPNEEADKGAAAGGTTPATTGPTANTTAAADTNAIPTNQEIGTANAKTVSNPITGNQSSRNATEGKATTQTFNINSFRSEISKNDTLATHSYLVTFAPFRAGFPENEALTNFVINNRDTLVLRCDNVAIPAPALLQEENIRRYGYGPVEKVPYGIQFTDISITWIVDKNSELIDFIYQWMNTIVMHDAFLADIGDKSGNRRNLSSYEPFEVGYKDAYSNPIVRVYIYDRQNQKSSEIEMYDVFPMNIQAQNLSWADENQLQKIIVNFACTNMKVKVSQIIEKKKFDQEVSRMIILGKNSLEEKTSENLLNITGKRDFKASFSDKFDVTVNASLPQINSASFGSDVRLNVGTPEQIIPGLPIKTTTGTTP